MDRYRFRKIIICQMLVMGFLLTGCLTSDVPTGLQRSSNIAGKLPCAPGQNCAGGDTGGLGQISDDDYPPKVEIRHLIEPNLSHDPNYNSGTGYAGGGSYVRKLTLPKNFQGRLYIAGINIGTLTDKLVKVRFKFGMNRESVTIPATVTQAPGITPQTGINVLVLDMRSEPFRNIRLFYDLYDYNDYNFQEGDRPVQDNLNTGLYCRGLRIEDDPTFTGVGACDGIQSHPEQPEEECLYAYAKVVDQGLVVNSGSVQVPITPSLPQAKSVVGSFYYMDSMGQHLLKPLLDTIPLDSNGDLSSMYRFASESNPPGATDSVDLFINWGNMLINDTVYTYRGPYQLVNTLEWQFRFSELSGPKRLFRLQGKYADGAPSYVDHPVDHSRIYFNSYMFPLATQLELGAHVPHLSSEDVFGTRMENSLPMAGKTLWMDGSNARAQSRNDDFEHIGSCNVTASIEIIARDNNENDYVIALAKDVKLQLVRPTQHRTDKGDEVLFTNFKTCSSNASCGGSECCFNNRCWDKSLVSQCYDSNSTNGNRPIGDSCSSDMECTSLCCNKTTGLCAPHNTLVSPPVLCSKPIGDTCIAKDWCQKTTVVKCLVISTGTDPFGNPTCRQHCYNVEEFGECRMTGAGQARCVPPPQPPIPHFDPSNPDACAEAVPAPNF